MMWEWIGVTFIFLGVLFFLAGTIGLLRFPDVFTRLHALTKVDNLGLGLITSGLFFFADSWIMVLKLILIWLLVIVSSATTAHLIARTALLMDIEPWKKQ